MVICGCVLIVLKSSYCHLAYVKTGLFVWNWIIFSIVCLGKGRGGSDTFSGSSVFIRKCSSWIASCIAAKQAEWGTLSAHELIACCDSKASLTQQPLKVWDVLVPVNPGWWDATTWASPSLFLSFSLNHCLNGMTGKLLLLFCFDVPCQSSQWIIYLLLRFLAAQCVDLFRRQRDQLWLLWVQVQHLSPLHWIRLAFSLPELGILVLSFTWCVSFPQRFLWPLLQQFCQMKTNWGKTSFLCGHWVSNISSWKQFSRCCCCLIRVSIQNSHLLLIMFTTCVRIFQQGIDLLLAYQCWMDGKTHSLAVLLTNN